MDLVIETERLILRELLSADAEAMFELDGNPNVHRYLGNNPVTSIEQVRGYIENIQNQYTTNRIARFAVVLKETNEVIGWSGLKYVTEPENNFVNFYDLGYRFQEKYWGKGYAFESAKPWIDYAFNEMKLEKLNADAHINNIGSNKILLKLGMKFINKYEWEGYPFNWYELENWNI